MDLETIMELVHNERIENFIPLKDIPDDKMQAVYQARYGTAFYEFPYHMESFRNMYPNLRADWVWCSRGVNPLYYWDKDHNLLLKFPVEAEFTQSPAEIEAYMAKELETCRKEAAAGDYSFIHRHLNGPMKLEYLKEILKTGAEVKNLFSLFISSYESASYGAALIGHEALKTIFASMPEEEKEKQVRKRETLSKTVRIYRGEGEKSTLYQNAFSWSLKLSAAAFFSTRLGKSGSRIIMGEAEREKILYLGEGFEQEAIILPEDIRVKEIWHQMDLDTLQENMIDSAELWQTYQKALWVSQKAGADIYRTMQRMYLTSLLYHIRCQERKDERTHKVLMLASIFQDIKKIEGQETLWPILESDALFLDVCGEALSIKKEAALLIALHQMESPVDPFLLRQAAPGAEANLQELLDLLWDASLLTCFFSQKGDLEALRLTESKELLLASRQLEEVIRENPIPDWEQEKEWDKLQLL